MVFCNMDLVSRIGEFTENEARGCSMNFGVYHRNLFIG